MWVWAAVVMCSWRGPYAAEIAWSLSPTCAFSQIISSRSPISAHHFRIQGMPLSRQDVKSGSPSSKGTSLPSPMSEKTEPQAQSAKRSPRRSPDISDRYWQNIECLPSARNGNKTLEPVAECMPEYLVAFPGFPQASKLDHQRQLRGVQVA